MTKFQNKEIFVILNNIRSNENVGSIFRTCDAAGVSKIILCGFTPTPIDRFGRENKGLTKASLGAEKFVAWEKFDSLKDASEDLKKEKFKIIGVEQDKNSVDYRELKNSNLVTRNSNLAFVFGNEVGGLSKEDLKFCDLIAEIPMCGRKESLNVSVVAGIILFEMID